MPKASDLSPETRFVALFVGRSGSGKTVAEASFPKPIHFNDFDGRIRGLLGAPWIDRKDITYDYFPPKEKNLIETLDIKLDTLRAAANSGMPIPKTYVTDSITNQTFAFICQSITLTHQKASAAGPQKGRFLGSIAMTGPEDYGLEAQATYGYMAQLKSLPIPNIIVSAHYIDRYGKPLDEDGNPMPYADSIVIGKQLSIRPKIGENIQTNFDHVFEFEREVSAGKEDFYVIFHSDIARTSYVNLPMGRHKITNKNFYEELMRLTKGEQK